MAGSKEDLAEFQKAKPFIRSIAAFVVFLRFGPKSTDDTRPAISGAYRIADAFIEQLEEDMKR